MKDRSTFYAALRQAPHGAKTWFLASAGLGFSFVILGRAAGVDAHKAYASALLLPFFLAAFFGTRAIATLRHGDAVKLHAAKGWRDYLLASFAWNVISLSGAVATDWGASQMGFLGRTPNDFLDSIGMVLVLSAALAAAAALPRQVK